MLSFGLMIALLVLVATIGQLGLNQSTRNYRTIVEHDDLFVAETRHLQAFVFDRARAVFGYLMTQDELFRADLEQANGQIEQALLQLESEADTTEEREIIDRLKEANADFVAIIEPIMKRNSFTEFEMRQFVLETIRGPREALQSAVRDMLDLAESDARESKAQADLATQAARMASIIVTLAASGLGFAFAFIMARNISRPVQLIAETAARVAEGDLTVEELNIKRSDEIGDMAKAFNGMTRSLRSLVQQVVESAGAVTRSTEQMHVSTNQMAKVAQGVAIAIEEVARGAASQTESVREAANVIQQLRGTIDQIASGAQEQANSTLETSSVVDQMVAAVVDINDKANHVDASSRKAGEAARAGVEVVGRTIEGMENIRNSVYASAERIRQLGKLSDQIGDITEVITEIADQTNLLALNAAIEAARAGEHGKGFAVVAEEVRQLAERAGASTSEIAELIQSIQSETLQTVKVMEHGTTEVEQGSRLAADAGNVLEDILSLIEQTIHDAEAIVTASRKIDAFSRTVSQAVENITAITEENSAATEQMAAGSGQIIQSVESIASISEENAATSEEVSTSVEELNASSEEIASSAQNLYDVAQKLQRQIERFKTS